MHGRKAGQPGGDCRAVLAARVVPVVEVCSVAVASESLAWETQQHASKASAIGPQIVRIMMLWVPAWSSWGGMGEGK